ncbi:hypothetical protein VNO77_20304 [Canavalia gladiata]|uniref:Uncharacterized protein n=1 Tax=Canavalia gladiata TaxID=3824 RepID=A0AAN9LPV7_CANGL
MNEKGWSIGKGLSGSPPSFRTLGEARGCLDLDEKFALEGIISITIIPLDGSKVLLRERVLVFNCKNLLTHSISDLLTFTHGQNLRVPLMVIEETVETGDDNWLQLVKDREDPTEHTENYLHDQWETKVEMVGRRLCLQLWGSDDFDYAWMASMGKVRNHYGIWFLVGDFNIVRGLKERVGKMIPI